MSYGVGGGLPLTPLCHQRQMKHVASERFADSACLIVNVLLIKIRNPGGITISRNTHVANDSCIYRWPVGETVILCIVYVHPDVQSRQRMAATFSFPQ